MPCNPCLRFQAPCAAFLRPAQWCSCLAAQRRAEDEQKFSFSKGDEQINIIRRAMDDSGLLVYSQEEKDSGFVLKAYVFTSGCGMLRDKYCNVSQQVGHVAQVGSTW